MKRGGGREEDGERETRKGFKDDTQTKGVLCYFFSVQLFFSAFISWNGKGRGGGERRIQVALVCLSALERF